MNRILDIVQGTTTFSLMARGVVALDYLPGAPSENMVSEGSSFIDGSLVGSIVYEDITETFRILIKGKTSSEVLTKIENLSRIFRLLREFRTYVVYKSECDSQIWQSPLNRGNFQRDEPLHITSRGAYAYCTVAWERKYYWESTTLTVIPLSGLYRTTPSVDPLKIIDTREQNHTTPLSNIDFVAATRRITDSSNGFVNFYIGMTVLVKNTSSNNGTYTVETVGPSGSYIQVVQSLVNETPTYPIVITPFGNYVDVLASNVTGSIPAPIRVEYFNSYPDYLGTWRTEELMIGHNVWSSPSTLPYIFEGEDATSGGSILPANPDLDAYSGGYCRVTNALPTVQAGYQILWSLTSAQAGLFKGYSFRVLVKLSSSPPADTWLGAQVRAVIGLTLLEETGLSLLSTASRTLYDLGVIRIPPGLPHQSSIYDLQISLTGTSPSGTTTLNVDYIALIPLQGWREFRASSYSLPYGGNLIDDNIQELTYVSLSGSAMTDSDRLAYYVPYGLPLMVYPGQAQRYYFYVTGGGPSIRTGTVRLLYRPRVTVL